MMMNLKCQDQWSHGSRQRSLWSRSNKGSKGPQVGCQKCQVTSFPFNFALNSRQEVIVSGVHVVGQRHHGGFLPHDVGTKYFLQREPLHADDPNAIALCTESGARRGYIMMEDARILAPVLDIQSVMGAAKVVSVPKWSRQSKRCGMRQDALVSLSIKQKNVSCIIAMLQQAGLTINSVKNN